MDSELDLPSNMTNEYLLNELKRKIDINCDCVSPGKIKCNTKIRKGCLSTGLRIVRVSLIPAGI